MEVDGRLGVSFGVWAPGATYVAVVGDFNDWDRGAHPLRRRDGSGIWEGFVPGVTEGATYKLHIAAGTGWSGDKHDPLAFRSETPPRTASIVTKSSYAWGDAAWMAERAGKSELQAPISIYEVHLGSWQRGPDGEWLGYRELAPRLVEHVRALGFTHVEFMPLTEHPFYGSWGYQTIGYYAPSARFGGPQDLMFLIDELHRAGIGVILDWVPGHFPGDAHGLARFDGTYLYEHREPRRRVHPEWHTMLFNHGRHEVRSFLISSAMLWIERYHVDGIRVDAVASMLYLSYARRPGEWTPNQFGGPENLDSVANLAAFVVKKIPRPVPAHVAKWLGRAAIFAWLWFAGVIIFCKPGPPGVLAMFGGPVYQIGLLLLPVMIVDGYLRKETWYSRLASIRPARWLGVRIYGIYVWHGIVLLVCAPAILAQQGLQAKIVGTFASALAIGAGIVSYRFLERPFLRRASKI